MQPGAGGVATDAATVYSELTAPAAEDYADLSPDQHALYARAATCRYSAKPCRAAPGPRSAFCAAHACPAPGCAGQKRTLWVYCRVHAASTT